MLLNLKKSSSEFRSFEKLEKVKKKNKFRLVSFAAQKAIPGMYSACLAHKRKLLSAHVSSTRKTNPSASRPLAEKKRARVFHTYARLLHDNNAPTSEMI